LVSALPLAQSSDPKVQMAGLLGSMYWFGRVGAQVPDQNLEDRIMAEVEQMKTGEVFQAEAKRCGLEMAARGQKLQAIGEDMQKKGKVLQQMENSR
jgi:hypothetical protein